MITLPRLLLLASLPAFLPAQEAGFHVILEMPVDQPHSIGFSRDSRHLAIGLNTTNAFVDLQTGAVQYAYSRESDRAAAAICPGSTGPEILMVDGAGIGLWNADRATRIRLYTVSPPRILVAKASLSPNGRTLAVGSSFGTAYLVDLPTGRVTEERDGMNDLVWDSQGTTLASVCGDLPSCTAFFRDPPKLLRLHDSRGEVLNETPVSMGSGWRGSTPARTVSFVPGQSLILAGSRAGMVSMDPVTGDIQRWNTLDCRWLRFITPDLVVIGDADSIALRNYPDLKLLARYGSEARVSLHTLSPNRRRVAFTTGDALVVLEIVHERGWSP